MQNLWFKGPIWFKGKTVKSPRKVPTPFRKSPEKVPQEVSGKIISTATWLKYKTRY